MARSDDPPDQAAGRPGLTDRWLVDGMNVIGSRPDGWWKDPDGAVRRFIDELADYARATDEVVTVVFDRRPPDVQPGPHGSVAVVFASWKGRNAADNEIVRIVATDGAPRSIRVVTSDRRLVERVRELGAGTVSSMSFIRRVADVQANGPE